MESVRLAVPPSQSTTRERVVPVRKLLLLVIATAVAFVAGYDPELATQVLLGLVTFNALDRLLNSVR